HICQRDSCWLDLATKSGERNNVILYSRGLEFGQVPATNGDKASLTTDQCKIVPLTLGQASSIDYRLCTYLIGQPGHGIKPLGVLMYNEIAEPIISVDFAPIGGNPAPPHQRPGIQDIAVLSVGLDLLNHLLEG